MVTDAYCFEGQKFFRKRKKKKHRRGSRLRVQSFFASFFKSTYSPEENLQTRGEPNNPRLALIIWELDRLKLGEEKNWIFCDIWWYSQLSLSCASFHKKENRICPKNPRGSGLTPILSFVLFFSPTNIEKVVYATLPRSRKLTGYRVPYFFSLQICVRMPFFLPKIRPSFLRPFGAV